MASALERCTRETIKISTSNGPDEVKAWRLGEFACHDGIGRSEGWWVVSHVPSGLALSSCGLFRSAEAAASAMERISADGDWSDLSEPALEKLGVMVRRVFASHGAETF